MIKKTKSNHQLIGAGLAIVASTYGLSRYVFGLFIPDIKADLNLSIQWVGFIASCSYVGYFFAMVISSLVSDKLGPRKTILLGGGSAFIGLSIIAFSMNQWMLMIGVVIAGMSPGLAYPPLSDAVVLMLDKKKRDSAYSIINSGTSIGIIISAPVALIAGERWRISWMIFAAIALIATVWNLVVITKKKLIIKKEGITITDQIQWLFNHASFKLFFYAFFLGVVTSSYWVFAVEYITIKNSNIYFLYREFPPEVFSKLFWIIVGISGLFGGLAGFFTKSFGLKLMLQVSTLSIVASILILTIFYDTWLGLFISALLFGSVFILITALIGIWSIHIFHDRPSMGFGVAFLILSIGQWAGPAFLGLLIDRYGLDILFYFSGFLGFILSFIKPKKEIYNMTP